MTKEQAPDQTVFVYQAMRDNIALASLLSTEGVVLGCHEEMQKTMQFILEHQAQFAVSIQRLQGERDQPRL